MTNKLLFVIQLHQATSLHYDLRLQVGALMPSWAIPKGPTLDPTVRRLAMQTDDHPLEYKDFEGVLPEGAVAASGVSPVMIWDEGYYLPEIEISKGVREEEKDFERGNLIMEEAMEKGELKFRVYGKKIQGSFALVKTKGFGPKDSWLMIKHKDEFVKEGYDPHAFDTSIRSGKSLKEIEKGE